MEKIVALLIIVGFIFSIYQAIMSGRLEIWLAALAIAMVFLKGVSYLEERRNKTE